MDCLGIHFIIGFMSKTTALQVQNTFCYISLTSHCKIITNVKIANLKLKQTKTNFFNSNTPGKLR